MMISRIAKLISFICLVSPLYDCITKFICYRSVNLINNFEYSSHEVQTFSSDEHVMLCYILYYVDGGFSSVSILQHTMLITSRQIVNLSIIKHSLSFLCKILLTQGVSVTLRERVFRKTLFVKVVINFGFDFSFFVEKQLSNPQYL